MVLFADRVDAGRTLAPLLSFLRDADPVVLGLPRGGVPVAAEVARMLGAPLDIALVRKLGVPGHREYAFGAIGEGDVRVLDPNAVRIFGITEEQAREVEYTEQAALDRQAHTFRGHGEPVDPRGRTVIIVDDGIATGATAMAACRIAHARSAWRVVVATPVAPPGWEQKFATVADDTVAFATPHPFLAVGQWYRDFDQLTDADVTALLDPES